MRFLLLLTFFKRLFCLVVGRFYLSLWQKEKKDENVRDMSGTRTDFRLSAIGSVLHFLVDGLCVSCLYLMAASFSTPHLVAVFVVYTLLAFATQPFTGWWADAMRGKHWLLLFSDVLLTAGMLVSSLVAGGLWASDLGIFVGASVLGMGNSMFHAWGGKQTALSTSNDIRALGVFVSTGAFGLAVGSVFFSWPLVYAFLLLVCVLSLLVVKWYSADIKERASTLGKGEVACGLSFASKSKAQAVAALAVVGLMALVMLRSSASSVFTSVIGGGAWMVLATGFTSMLGKMSGGWLSRWLGLARAFALVIVLAGACWLLGSKWSVAGLFFINCTMPMTLYLANEVMKGREGLAFGLLAAALVPGYLLATL